MEELLEARILSRGNELFVETDDAETQDLLSSMLGELEDHVNMGQSPNPDLIRAVYDSLTRNNEEQRQEFKNTSINITATGAQVFPRSYAQAVYIGAMADYDMVFGIGPAGTGKTYLAVAHALREVLSRRKRKLILTRPVVEAGERLGFLPGDLAQKINPYLKPLYDAMESLAPGETIQKLEDDRVIEIAPLAYMRGRSLNDCYIILDEAQNTTQEQMKMFLTRIGEGSRTVITGDVTQVDLPDRRKSGLLHAMKILGTIPEIHFSYFTSRDVVRNALVKKIIEAYEAEAH
ncbi:MAG: AAA family ATPase [Spirochaetes bacterium]|jgi:phosphate starvation-inducible PhoH-like protein|nr:AAA family ATPase [Spirochaetota bacterium]